MRSVTRPQFVKLSSRTVAGGLAVERAIPQMLLTLTPRFGL
jgi:hypothetical protein